MTRIEQVEKLAEAWQSLGDGRRARLLDHGLCWRFYRDGNSNWLVVDVQTTATDTTDATPALAILRDVKGEDWTINQQALQGDTCWFAMPIDSDIWDDVAIVSDISRIHAVTLAIQERNIE